MVCSLCGQRRARRSCPAVGEQICPVCCGTKRQVQIQCPIDCPYLATAREHPPAAAARQQQRDLALMAASMHDLSREQAQLLYQISTFLRQYEPPEFQAPSDADVAEATTALAATFETASRGLIYEHRAALIPAERLATALKPFIAQASGGRSGSTFERDVAVVLRRIEATVREASTPNPSNRRAYLDLLGRVLQDSVETLRSSDTDEGGPRLIVP